MTLANRITFFRLLMIPVFAILLMSYRPNAEWLRYAAIAVFTVAALSDGVDGFVARAFNQKTKLGARLDPLADKLLVNIAFVFLAVNPYLETRVPGWIPVVVLLRDACITGGAYLINTFRGPVRVRPRILGKFNTALQIAAILAVLLEVGFAYELLMLMVTVAIVSWVDYVVAGLEQASERERV